MALDPKSAMRTLEVFSRWLPLIQQYKNVPIVAEPDAAVTYYRVSDKKQLRGGVDAEGNSIPTQREVAEFGAKELKLRILDEYVEPGVSAQDLDKRVEFMRLIERVITRRDVRYVIVYVLSRSSRKSNEFAIIELILEALGCSVISVQEKLYGTGDNNERLTRQILMAINEHRVRSDGDDIKIKMLNKAKNGGTNGIAKVGYLNVSKHDVDGRRYNTVGIDAERAPYIRQMFELAATGRYSDADIQQIVTERGLVTRRLGGRPSGPISVSKVGVILQDRYYLGYVSYKGIEYRGNHEPILKGADGFALFERVQRLRSESSYANNRRSIRTHHLKGLLWCPRCKRRFILSQNKGEGGTYLYYFCMGRRDRKCTMPYLPVDTVNGVDAAVSANYATARIGDTDRAALAQIVEQALSDSHGSSDRTRATLEHALTSLKDQEKGLIAKVGNPNWDDKLLDNEMIQVRRKQAAIEGQLAKLDNPAATDTGRAVFLKALELLANNPRRFYDNADDDIKTALTRVIWSRLYLEPDQNGTVHVTAQDLNEPFRTIHQITQAELHADPCTPPAKRRNPGNGTPRAVDTRPNGTRGRYPSSGYRP